MSRKRRHREPPPDRAFHQADPRRALLRVAIALAVGALVALLVPLPSAGFAVHAVAGWDAAGLTLLGIMLVILMRTDAAETRRRAGTDDPGRRVVWLLVTFASTFSLFAAAVVLRQAKSLAPGGETVFVVLCLMAVVTAWGVTHASYALRYAHLYYRDRPCDPVGGLTFPGDAPPDAFDFAYFAFTIGMCFQVSDVTITSRPIRRAVLGQSLLAFAYNTAILALALNLVFGLLT